MAEIGKKPTAIRIHSAIYSEVEKGQFIKLDGISAEINGMYKVLDSHKEPSGGVSILARKISPAEKVFKHFEESTIKLLKQPIFPVVTKGRG